jgi:hypothetical protein
LWNWHASFLLFVGIRSTSAVTKRPHSIDECRGICDDNSAVASRPGTRYCAITLLRVHFQERTCTI